MRASWPAPIGRPVRSDPRTRVFAPLVCVAATALVAVASFLPWARSGERSRNSYELFRLAERLDVVGAGAPSWGVRVWFLVPMAAAIGVLCAALGNRRLAVIVCTGVGLAGCVAAVLVLNSPLKAASGLPITLVAGSVTLVTGAVALLGGRTT